MKILFENELKDFDFKLFNNNGKISLDTGDLVTFDPKATYIVPGFIDQHIHGAGNSDVMDNTQDAIKQIARTIVKEGTTTFYPTTMTYDLDVVKQVNEKISELKKQNITDCKIGGVHLEGPFIDGINYIGAQNPNYVKKPDATKFDFVNVDDIIKIVTYAVEYDDNYSFTKYLASKNVIASVGHSGATASQTNMAIENGLNNFTHFHNASSGHHHRTPGVVTSGLMNKDVNVELICDNIHVNPDAIKATYNIKGYENITLITDSMCAKGCPDGEYELGGQKVIKTGSEARLVDGTLAGSVLKMNDAVKNIYMATGCPVQEAFLMASYNVAKHLGLSDRGVIKSDFCFDITVLDADFNVLETYCDGKKVF